VVAFVAVWAAGMGLLHFVPGLEFIPAPVQGMNEAASASGGAATRYGILAMHVLMAAYFAHLVARTVHLTFRYRKIVLDF